MIRSTLRDAARRIQTFASRATLREMDLEYKDDYWPRIKQMDVMASESPTGVEWVQSYGSVSIPAKQDKEDNPQQQKQQQSGGNGAGGSGNQQGEQGEQPKGDAAEPIVMYLNGSRSHPMVIGVGDRRHQLMMKGEGDVASYRLKDDKQQFLMVKEGNYLTTRDDKRMRIALVAKDQQQDQQQGQGQQQGGQQKQKKQYGQESTQKDNEKSEVAIEQNGGETFSRHGEAYSSQRKGSDATQYYKERKFSHQVTEEHAHMRFDKNWIWNDKEGNWMFPPLLVKKDPNCKE